MVWVIWCELLCNLKYLKNHMCRGWIFPARAVAPLRHLVRAANSHTRLLSTYHMPDQFCIELAT
jgi:hypothetical protein